VRDHKADGRAWLVGARASAGATGGGTTSVQTNIQSINVQTSATDATGISQSIGEAMKKNSLINYGTVASQ